MRWYFVYNIVINGIAYSINYSKILLFADYAKIFKAIKSPSDHKYLQKDLLNVNNWFTNNNGISLNINKCQTITF